jgi:hypothetical protein
VPARKQVPLLLPGVAELSCRSREAFGADLEIGAPRSHGREAAVASRRQSRASEGRVQVRVISAVPHESDDQSITCARAEAKRVMIGSGATSIQSFAGDASGAKGLRCHRHLELH